MSQKNTVLDIQDIIRDVISSNPSNPQFSIENIINAGKTDEMRRVIDQIYIQNGFGSVKAGITRNLYGINFAGSPNTLPINRDHYGYTFFTKPMMNMTDANLRNDRVMSQLLNQDETSIHRLIRCYLDAQVYTDESRGQKYFRSPFVNLNSGFIPLLSNNLLSLSGWPDYDSQVYTSGAGNWREEYSFVDGIIKDYRTWDMSCSFRNVDGNIVTMLFFYWVLYQAGVGAVGNLVPYPNNAILKEIDYNTAIYRVTLSQDRRTVTGIARTIAYPTVCPIGAQFNFEHDGVLNDSNNQVSIQFKCHGAEYNDDILIREFNTVTEYMDPDFRDQRREQNYVCLPPSLYRIFNGKAQPRINPYDNSMEWWVRNEDYLAESAMFIQQYSLPDRFRSLAQQAVDYNPKSRAAAEALNQQNRSDKVREIDAAQADVEKQLISRLATYQTDTGTPPRHNVRKTKKSSSSNNRNRNRNR